MIDTNNKTPFARPFLMQYFSKSWHSLQYKPILLLSFLPSACAIALWIGVITLGITHFDWFIQQFPNIWIAYALKQGVLPQISYYLLIFFATLSMLLCGVIVVGICMNIINAFLTPIVVHFVHKIHYPHVVITPPTFIESCSLSGKLFLQTFLKFAFFSFCCYVLSFIGLGFIGLIVGVFIYFQFYCKNLNHDVGISIMPKDTYMLFLRHNKIPLMFINILIFMPLYIPILNCFIATWQILVLTHYMFAWYMQYIDSITETHIEDAIIIELESHAS